MRKDEFERRLLAAVEGERPDEPTRLDESLRALVEQLHGGPSAPSSGQHRIVRADAPGEEPEN